MAMTIVLPPHLADLHTQLQTPGRNNDELRDELEAVAELVAHVRARDPEAAVLHRIDDLILRKGFTDGSSGSCECCGRPF